MDDKKILIIIGHYLPGYKDGGPIRSVKNLTDRLGDEYDFFILTSDREQGDQNAYPQIKYEEWNQVGKANVYYVRPNGFTSELISEKAKNMDIVYLCGCFNDYARITLRLKKRGIIQAKIVIASMGLFSSGAFHIKYWKKKLYIEILKKLGYFKTVEWSATGEEEIKDIKQIIGINAICHQAQDIPQQMERMPAIIEKRKGKLKVIFLSRISRKKNLDYALDVLQKVKGDIVFDIYGMKEDEKYYVECIQKAEKLPPNIHCTYQGEVLPENVIEIFSRYQMFLFPTKGENYGHVIFEALAGGCIPVISDQTPWNVLEEKGIGWALPLLNQERFITIIQELVDMNPEVYAAMQKKAAEYAWKYSKSIQCQGYRDIFDI